MKSGVYKPNTGDIIFQEIESEIILLNLKNGNYFSLDNIGVLIWDCVLKHIPSDILISTLLMHTKEAKNELIEASARVFEELLKEGLSLPHDVAADDSDNFREYFAKKISESNFNLIPPVLNSYKNIQEKYAHPCGVKEI